jgi:hypothetical protein
MGTPPSDKYEQDTIFQLIETNVRKREQRQASPWKRPMQWWYRLTSPPLPSPKASLQQRELYRRAQLTSTILLLVLIITLAIFPLTMFGPLDRLFFIITGSLILTLLTLFLNRQGRTTPVGIILVSFFTIGFYTGMLVMFNQIGLTTNELNSFDLLILSELFAVSLLPPGYVFLLMGGNCLFILANLALQPRTPELALLFANEGYYYLMVRPLLQQMVVAVVAYLWVSSAIRATARADQAEALVTLEHTLATRKQQLEQGVELLLRTLVQAANGDLNVRTPLLQDQRLWQIAGSLNTLLGRLEHLQQIEQDRDRLQDENEQLRSALHETTHLEKDLADAQQLAEDYFILSQQHAQQSDNELEQLQGEVALLVKAINTAKTKKQPIWSGQHGNILDPLIGSLQGNYLYPFAVPTHGQQITIVKHTDN